MNESEGQPRKRPMSNILGMFSIFGNPGNKKSSSLFAKSGSNKVTASPKEIPVAEVRAAPEGLFIGPLINRLVGTSKIKAVPTEEPSEPTQSAEVSPQKPFRLPERKPDGFFQFFGRQQKPKAIVTQEKSNQPKRSWGEYFKALIKSPSKSLSRVVNAGSDKMSDEERKRQTKRQVDMDAVKARSSAVIAKKPAEATKSRIDVMLEREAEQKQLREQMVVLASSATRQKTSGITSPPSTPHAQDAGKDKEIQIG